jgi:tetratricopeptide (TPR) repeat protein
MHCDVPTDCAHPLSVVRPLMQVRPLSRKAVSMSVSRIVLALFLGFGALTAVEQRDLIILKANNQKKYAIIDSERADELITRATSNSQPSKQRLHEVKSWTYREMEEGYWPQAVQARDQGRLAIAADMFNALAVTGDREWMKVYGAYNEGICWELLGDWTKAADAFGRAAAVEPAHRLALDAQYRQGFALARMKNAAEAGAIADALDEIAKKDRNKSAEARAHAIRAALAYNGGDAEALKKEGRSVVFPREETEATVQFGAFLAEAFRQLGKLREAKGEYETLLGISGIDAASMVPLQLGYAKTLLDDGDKASAMVELMRIDALPYGTVDQKCETRYLAGKLLAEQVKESKAKGDPAEATIGSERSARLLLNAAANSTSSITAKSAAASELEALGPDPDAPVDEKAKGDKPADGSADAKDAKAAPAEVP